MDNQLLSLPTTTETEYEARTRPLTLDQLREEFGSIVDLCQSKSWATFIVSYDSAAEHESRNPSLMKTKQSQIKPFTIDGLLDFFEQQIKTGQIALGKYDLSIMSGDSRDTFLLTDESEVCVITNDFKFASEMAAGWQERDYGHSDVRSHLHTWYSLPMGGSFYMEMALAV